MKWIGRAWFENDPDLAEVHDFPRDLQGQVDPSVNDPRGREGHIG